MKKEALLRNGSAVVIVLAFLLLITVLAVGLMETIRTENVSANTHLGGVQAEFYAQAAVDRVVGALQKQTAPQQSGTNMVYNWVSQPGQLIVGDTSNNGALSGTVELYSGSADTTLIADSRTYLRPPNLNIATFRTPSTYLLTPHTGDTGYPPEMYVAWVYVRKDGTLETSSSPDLTNKTNPIVGRYAYWTDDESSKVNLNLAYGRTGNTKPTGDPSQIDLTALRPLASGETDSSRVQITLPWANLISQGIASPRFYNSPEDVRLIASGNETLAKALENYKFETTHYSTDPDTTFFNEKRIVLTTNPKNVPVTASGTAPFLNILSAAALASGADVGHISSIDETKLNAVLSMMITPGTGYLTRTDWPMSPGSSFQQKYYSGYPDRMTQLAINIIDYVRSKESSLAVVEPLRGQLNNPGASNQWFQMGNYTGTTSYIGAARTPLISEVGVYVPLNQKSGTDANYYPTVKVEVYSPPYYNLGTINLVGYKLNTIICKPGSGGGTGSITSQEEVSLVTSEVSTTSLNAGGYATITHVFGSGTSVTNSQYGTRSALTGSGMLKIRVALTPPANARADIAPLCNSTGDLIPVMVDNPSVAPTRITSSEVDDPRVNKCAGDWKMRASGNSFGSQNSTWSPGNATSSTTPPQDTGTSGKISAASMYMPPRKGSTGSNGAIIIDNSLGLVTSVGELGFIHTGVQSATNSTVTAGVPWRTLRLQPGSGSLTTVPDWAFMDLFTVPMLSATDNRVAVLQPNNTSYGGRININAHIRPFDAAPYNIQRILPLAAAAQGCTYDNSTASTVTSDTAQLIASNIYNHTVATGGTLYNFTGGYYSPGEVVEIKGVADGGEQSEEFVRETANLFTARGNVFTVYSVGEAVKQTSDGRLVVIGQRRLQSMVERYVDPSTAAVRFRAVYYRNINP